MAFVKYGDSTNFRSVKLKASYTPANGAGVPICLYFNFGTAHLGTGLDIVITDGSSLIPRTVQVISGGRFQVWFRDPTVLSSTGGTEVFCQWGGATVSEANDSNVWINNFNSTDDHAIVVHGEETIPNLIDSSGNYTANDVAITYGGVGKIGRAPEFNGSNSSSNFGDISEIVDATELTISGWLSLASLSADYFIAAQADVSAGVDVYASTGELRFATASSSAEGVFDLADYVNADEFFHMCWVYDGGETGNSNRLKCYINGDQVPLSFTGTIDSDLGDSSSLNFLIGNSVQSLDGLLDELRIFPGALTANQNKLQYDNQRLFEFNGTLELGQQNFVKYGNSTNYASVQLKAAYVDTDDINAPICMMFDLGTPYLTATGLDIVITDGVNLIPREVRAVGDGTFQIWFRDPSQSVTTGGTKVWCQWGGSSVSVANDPSVWAHNYDSDKPHPLVTHLEYDAGLGHFRDSSGNYTGAETNMLSVLSGKIERAAEFGDPDSNIAWGDITEIDATQKLTISFWMNQDVLDTFDTIFFKDLVYRIYTYTDGSFRIGLGDGIYGYWDYSADISAGVFAHVIVVFDGSGAGNSDRLKVYVDGVLITLSFVGTIPTVMPSFGSNVSIGHSSDTFDGEIDEFRLWLGALNADQVSLMYENQDQYDTNGTLDISIGGNVNKKIFRTGNRAFVCGFR